MQKRPSVRVVSAEVPVPHRQGRIVKAWWQGGDADGFADAGADPDTELHAARHRLQHEAFLRHEDAHERIGRHHREVMARMRELEECAGAAM